MNWTAPNALERLALLRSSRTIGLIGLAMMKLAPQSRAAVMRDRREWLESMMTGA